MSKLLISLMLFTFTVSLQATDSSKKSSFYSCDKKVGKLNIEELKQISSIPLKVGSDLPFTNQLDNVKFDTSKYKGKTVVLLVSATWCGYCKYDILKNTEWRTKKSWPKKEVVIVHMIVSSGEQDLDEALGFIKTPKFQNISLNLDGTDFYFSEEKNLEAFQEMKDSFGNLLFPGLIGTPYAIIFDSKGDARFRGHYTARSKDFNADYNEHYQFINDVASGSCISKQK